MVPPGKLAKALESCVRQMLFVRPDKVVIVDRLRAAPGKELPDVEWLLQLPQAPAEGEGFLSASNGKSWLRLQALLPGGAARTITATPVNTHRVSLDYPGKPELALVHFLEVGDGKVPVEAARISASLSGSRVEVSVGGKTFRFEAGPDHAVTSGSSD